VRRLAELTGGNPLFVVECARALRTPSCQLGSLPPTVRQVVLDRLAMLPDATRDALASGAVLGREFSAASVARMHGLLPAQVIEALLHALRSGLVAEARPGQFAFSHALVRDAVYAALDPMKRAETHRCAASALSAEKVDTAELPAARARAPRAGRTAGRGSD
jgi:predicted ATPase